MTFLEVRLSTNRQISLVRGTIEVADLVAAANDTNKRLVGSQKSIGNLDLYDIIDLRMLSGLIGELYTDSLAEREPRLIKNPNIDGYPDLCDISDTQRNYSADEYIAFPDGGLEVKNTFGVKRSGVEVGHRATRAGLVQKTLVWKAHHRTTNRLIALRSDYIDRIPQIVAGYFADNLTPDDWTEKQQPKPGSTMTSFCQTRPSAFGKLQDGLMFVHPKYKG